MTIDAEGDAGQAVVVPVLDVSDDVWALFAEAEALWQAEKMDAGLGSISARWGCVGVCFKDASRSADWKNAWAERFREKEVIPLAPVTYEGILEIPWPKTLAGNPLDVDVLIATATMAEKNIASPEAIANAWINQDNGYEEYFFENVKNGVRTPLDGQIWQHISQRKPAWLSKATYVDAIAILEGKHI